MNSSSATQVSLTLQANGPLSAAELGARTGFSQPTISRAVVELGSSILRIRQGRGFRYALRRSLAQWGGRWPLYEVAPDGEATLFGTLTAVFGGYHLDLDAPNSVLLHGEYNNGLFPDLPWFIQDMRPRGFMGRAFARSHEAILHLSTSPEKWSSDEILIALLAYGSDLPGSFVIGRGSMDALLQAKSAPAPALTEAARADSYPALADAALSGEPPGSSAGGEQPKFTATLQGDSGIRQVLVKFSGEHFNPSGRRSADLLVAEFLAAETLASAGIPAATGSLAQARDRTFLEVPRFDRVGEWGRRPVATLEALDAGLAGSGAALWGEAIPTLREQGFVTGGDALWLETAFQFGLLIGNDDMHPGNLAFHLTPELPLRPAPIYDMLPMQYRPGTQGDLPAHAVRIPPARPEERQARNRALPLASAYWRRLAEDPRISEDFRRIAVRNANSETSR